jgi:hypothetical protein
MNAPDDQHLLPRPSEEISKKDKFLESLPESMRWNPVPGSDGHQSPECADEEEDSEGRSQTERLVDDGVEAAEREQVKQAARAAKQSK